MKSMQCKNESHKGKIINTICFDKSCKSNRLCCLLCIKNFHMDHLDYLIEVNQISAFLEQEINKEVNCPYTCTEGQNQIVQGLEQLSILTDNLQKIIKEEIELQKSQNLQDYLKKMGNKYQGIEYWQEILEGMLRYVEIDNCNIMLKQQNEALNKQEQRYLQIIKQAEESLKKIINRMHQGSINEIKSNFCFQDERKNADIQIIDQNTIKKTSKESFSMAYYNEGFDPNSKSYQFAFDIQTKAIHMWIGVGNDEGDNKASCLISRDKWETLGHGHYMISQHQLLFHHTNKELNHKAKGMTFVRGDKIQIKYDHVTKVLEFKKESEPNAVIEMEITDLTKILYPCVMLYYPNDQVQLLEY